MNSISEVSASLYAWDLWDEGAKRILDVLQDLSRINSVYLVGLMHSERRPLDQFQTFYPHNPVRRYYSPEDSRVYWIPEDGEYRSSRIKPMQSAKPGLGEVDWLDELVEEAKARGLKVGCEVSRTLVDAEAAFKSYRDVLQRNVYGDVVCSGRSARRAVVCINNQDARSYVGALFRDLVKNHEIDFVQSCQILFAPGASTYSGTIGRTSDSELWPLLDVATGGCFCRACEEKAVSLGLDWLEMVNSTKAIADLVNGSDPDAKHARRLLRSCGMTVSGFILENRGFWRWLQFRTEAVSEFLGFLSATIHDARRDVEFRYSNYMAMPELSGLDFRSGLASIDSVRESDCSEQLGSPADIDTKRQKILKIRRAVSDSVPVIAAIGARPKATPELVEMAIWASVESGASGLSVAHFDGATRQLLRAVGSGIDIVKRDM